MKPFFTLFMALVAVVSFMSFKDTKSEEPVKRSPNLAEIEAPSVKHNCNKEGHTFGPWYKQAQMYYIPQQPAHICLACGYFQNMNGRAEEIMLPIRSNPKHRILMGTPEDTKLMDETYARLRAEVNRDIPDWDKAPVEDHSQTVGTFARPYPECK